MDNTGRPLTVVGERGNRTELGYNELGLPAYMASIIVDNANQSVDERNTFSLQFDEYARLHKEPMQRGIQLAITMMPTA